MSMYSKQKISLIFLGFLSFIVFTGVWYGLRFESHTEKIPFSPQQLRKIEECQQAEIDLENVAESNIVCYSKKETKKDIILLSTYPVTGASVIRAIYEEATHHSSYTQYRESGSFTQACDFQTGPWKLFCNMHPDEIKCLNTSPPPGNTPYFVNTNYPTYEKMCDSFGYQLPRHEKVIHVIRNPVDNIAAWIHYDYGDLTKEAWTQSTVKKYMDEYDAWHTYWKNYHNEEPETPVEWIRYEDMCLCMEPAMQKILRFTEVLPQEDKEALQTILKNNPCTEVKELGKGVS